MTSGEFNASSKSPSYGAHDPVGQLFQFTVIGNEQALIVGLLDLFVAVALVFYRDRYLAAFQLFADNVSNFKFFVGKNLW